MVAERLGLAVGIDELGPEVGLGQVLGLHQLARGDALGHHLGQDLVEDRDRVGGAMTAGAGHRHPTQRRIAKRRELDVDRRHQLALDHQAAVQPGRRAAGQERGGQLEGGPVGVGLADRAPAQEHPVAGDRLGADQLPWPRRRRLDQRGAVGQGGGRQIAVGRDHLGQEVGLVDRADHHQGGVVDRVPGPVERADLLEGDRADVRHPPDRRPAIRVDVERGGHELLVEPAVDIVLDALAALVGDDVALGLDGGRLEHQAVHALALEADREGQLVGRQAEAVVGPVDPGRGVGLAAGGLDDAIELAGRQRLGLAEHQVLEQVREAGLADLLVARADPEPGLVRHDRRAAIDGAHHAEPVAQAPAPDRHSADRAFGFESHACECGDHPNVLPGPPGRAHGRRRGFAARRQVKATSIVRSAIAPSARSPPTSSAGVTTPIASRAPLARPWARRAAIAAVIA